MWKVPFVSRSGRLYTVTIYGGGSGVTTLRGSAEPFVTEEDNDDDMFMPVRTQSGYLRIADNGLDADGQPFDWTDMMPETDLSHRVTLTHTEGGQTVTDWMGYMQAQDFGSSSYGRVEERSFAVQCILSTLGATTVDATPRTLKNFAYVILQAFGSLTGTEVSRYVFQGGTKAQGWLLKKVDWQNMVSGGDHGVTGKYDNLSLLQSVCQFWGWSCRVCGDVVYFVCPDDSTVGDTLTLTSSALVQLAAGEAAGTIESGFLESGSVTGDVFASTNNNSYLVRGYGKSMVESDGNEADEEVMVAFPSSVENDMIDGGYTTEQYDTGAVAYVTNDITTFATSFLNGSCVSGSASFNMMRTRKRTGDASWYSDIGTFATVRIKQSYTGNAFASFETNFEHSYYDATVPNGGFDTGGLYIAGDVYRKGERYVNADSHGTGKTYIYLRVGIGSSRQNALWYNGESWSSSLSSFKVRVGWTDEQEFLYNINTRHVDMTGKLFVDLLGSDDIPEINGQRRFDFVNFGVLFKRRVVYNMLDQTSRAASRDYTASNNNKTKDEWTAYLDFASDNDMVFGYGVLLEPGGTQMGKQDYGVASEYAEQHLANRVSDFWSSAKHKREVELRRQLVPAFTPKHTVAIIGDARTYYPTSISHSWRKDVLMLSLMEL